LSIQTHEGTRTDAQAMMLERAASTSVRILNADGSLRGGDRFGHGGK
jgi:hypothetical protein